MGLTKRHVNADGSSKWLPQVAGNDKKPGNASGGGQAATTTIQIGKGEIHVTNQAQSPGPSSIKMYQSNAQQSH